MQKKINNIKNEVSCMSDVVEKISEAYNVDLLKLVTEMLSSDCNQCHSNCNDCGYDR